MNPGDLYTYEVTGTWHDRYNGAHRWTPRNNVQANSNGPWIKQHTPMMYITRRMGINVYWEEIWFLYQGRMIAVSEHFFEALWKKIA